MSDKNSKSRKAAPKSDIQGPKMNSVLCPICRTILSEPVSLPCSHTFCRPCFEGSMEHTSLLCPLCRLRVSSWYRRTKREGKLVDEGLWKAIQREYPLELKNKRRGIDSVIEKDQPVIIVAKPGEIRKEYEKEKVKHLDEQRKTRIAEENASASLIKQLEEEEKLRQELEERKVRLDAIVAKKLAEELSTPSTSKATSSMSTKSNGPLDRFILSEGKCHKRPERKISPRVSKSISYDLDFHEFLGDWKRKPPKIEQNSAQSQMERKASTSSYKSSASGNNSDDIDQEFKYYFKPINPAKQNHPPLKTPLAVPAIRVVYDISTPIRAPLRPIKLVTHSAFARFSHYEELQKVLSCQIAAVTPVNKSKRKCSSESVCSETKKSCLSPADASRISPPFLGFKPSEIVPYKFDELIGDRKNNETDINENIRKTVSTNKPVNGSSRWLRSNSLNSCNNSSESSAENLRNVIDGICNKLWEDSPERRPRNGVKKTADKRSSSDIQAVIDVDKSPRNKAEIEAKKQKRRQEEADFAYAKRLQAQFDLMHVKSRTRRGTQRQTTLNELLSG
ncbi:uncharacterized protein [Euwallacea fornicatus]|uniref:uncharacterized protein n=1 Tax=Euwallacea fornicatus TaxID=995702 RepID=UPI00338D5C73